MSNFLVSRVIQATSRCKKSSALGMCFLMAITIASYMLIAHRHYKLDKYLLVNFYLPNAGADIAVPQISLDIQTLAKNHKLTKFELAKEIREDTLLYQRTIEFLYPIRESQSNYVFSLSEIPLSNCVKLDQLHQAMLYECR